MNGTIPIPKLSAEQAAEIQRRRAAGESLNQISAALKIRYTAVYFYAVNGGKRAEVEKRESPASCWCGQWHYAKGLCHRHYWQQHHRARRLLRAEVA